MTIGIATPFSDGLILCSDTRIVAFDGATSTQSKQSISAFASKKLVAISYAADDVDAAKMLAQEIVSAVGDTQKPYEIIPAIKKIMGTWYRSYGKVTTLVPPRLEFLMTFVDVEEQTSSIYKCVPPSTVVSAWGPTMIGCGVTPVEPHLGLLTVKPGKPPILPTLKSALFRLAYLMYLSKRDAGQFVGGATEVIVVSNAGSFTFVSWEEMKRAQDLAEKTDALIGKFSMQILSGEDEESNELPDDISRKFAEIIKERDGLVFSSLVSLNRAIWKPKPSVARKSKGQP
jgi:hypothetical protein